MPDIIALAEHRVRGSRSQLPDPAARWRHAAFRAAYHAALADDAAMERCALGFAVKAARELAWARALQGGGAR